MSMTTLTFWRSVFKITLPCKPLEEELPGNHYSTRGKSDNTRRYYQNWDILSWSDALALAGDIFTLMQVIETERTTPK